MTTSIVARRRTAHHRSYSPPGRPPRAVLDLGAVPTAPGCGRAWTRQVLWEWRLVGISDTADLIVTELTTNAVLISRQAGQPFIRLILTLDQGELAILVRDFCPGTPQPGNARADDENGRGLFLVQSMSDRFGWYPADDGSPARSSGPLSAPDEKFARGRNRK